MVWMVGLSSPMLHNMPDLFHDDQDLPESPSLRISDCIPLSVQVQQNLVEETEDQQNSPYHQSGHIDLAISRLR
jgi:hypothetical protein